MAFSASNNTPDEVAGMAAATSLTHDTWTTGDITSAIPQNWFSFTATATTHHVHLKGVTLSDLYVQLYDSNGNKIDTRYNLFNSSRQYDSLASGETYFAKVTPYSSSDTGTYQIAFTNVSGEPGILAKFAGATALTHDTWTSGNIATAGSEQWFSFTAAATTHHVHLKGVTLSDLYVQLYDSNGNKIDTRYNLFNSSRQYDSLASGETYFAKVTAYSDSSTGTYQIGFTTVSGEPGTLAGIAGATPLTHNAWTNGNIGTVGGEQWFSFAATATTHHMHLKGGTLSDVYIQLHDDSGNKIGTRTNVYSYSTQYNSLVSGKTYYVKVTPYSNSGSGNYQIGFTSFTASPDIIAAIAGASPLSINAWMSGTIATAGSAQWYSFTATAASHYVHLKSGTLSNVYIQLYDGNGNTIGNRINLGNNPSSTQYNSLTSGTTYFIKLTPYSSSSTGTYQIGFTSVSGEPGTLAGIAGAAPVTLDAWTSGNIATAGSAQWFSFTATATTHHVQLKAGTLYSVYVQLHDISGNKIGDRINLANNPTSTQYESLTSGEAYFVKVTPYSSSSTGTYQIAATTISGEPGTLTGIAGATPLTLDTWTSGTIAAAGSEQWFSLSATATTHHVHFKGGSLSDVYVQLYTSNGNKVGLRTNLYSATRSAQYTSLLNGQAYYIKVTAYSSSSTGTYQIGFTKTVASPDDIAAMASATALTLDTWANGSITAAVKEQWYKFDATMDTQYIHFKAGTLSNVYMSIYTSSAEKQETQNLSTTYTSTSSYVTTGNTYYIRITPYFSSYTGTFKIAFSKSATTPTE